MSIKPTQLAGAALTLVTLIVILSRPLSFPSARGPASLPSDSKSAHFKPHLGITSKPNQSIRVSIEVVDGFPSSNDEVAILRAKISASNQITGAVDFQWTLPPGAELVSGELMESISNMGSDEIVREISVRGFSSEGLPRNVTLEATSRSNGNLVGTTGVMSSHPTDVNLNYGFRKSKEALRRENAESATGRAQAPKGLRL